jgi:uncharacterized Fe-S center protein
MGLYELTLEYVNRSDRYSRPEEEKSYGKTDALSRIDFNKLFYRVTDTDSDNFPTVYFTDDLSPEGFMKLYNILKVPQYTKTAVKLSSGEMGGNYFLNPNLVKEFIDTVNGTIVECNTAYPGKRTTVQDHEETLRKHGWYDIANVDIMDRDGEFSIPCTGCKNMDHHIVGNHIKDYDFMWVLSHFKGHACNGYGGALKNIAIGCGSPNGKRLIHSGGISASQDVMSNLDIDPDLFTECVAEGAKAIYDFFKNPDELHNRMCFINVMNNMSVDCDCSNHPKKPTMKDIGILASFDPVALDQACLDLVFAAPDSKDLVKRITEKHGTHTVEWSNEIGTGSRFYKLEII